MVYVFVSLLPTVIVAVASGIRPNDRPNIKLFMLFVWSRSFPCLFFYHFRSVGRFILLLYFGVVV